MKQLATLIVLVYGFCPIASAAPALPGLFSDHMVVQRGKPIPVWGRADPGESLRVTLADTSAGTVAGADGRWRVVLEPLAAGGPFTLVVEGKARLAVRDVLIGEVWVASGQSNMNFALRGASTATEDLSLANHGGIRLFTLPKSSSLKPMESAEGRWVTCSQATAGEFSAVAYYFGLELHRRLGVPVGLVHTSWPGTAAEEWIDAASIAGDPDFAAIGARWRAVEDATTGLEDRPADFDLSFADMRLVPDEPRAVEPVLVGEFRKGTLHNDLGGEWSYSWESAPFSRVEMSPAGTSGGGWVLRNAGQLRFGETALLQLSFLKDGNPTNLTRYSGIRFRCRGRGFFKVHVLQPTIADWDNYCTQVIAADKDWSEVEIHFKDLRQAGWGEVRPFTRGALTGIIVEFLPGLQLTKPPGGLFNGMIAPLIPYAIRGVIWYQGEGNAGRAWQYRKLLPTLIRSWRSAWHQDDFPFLIVQLPNFGERRAEPSESEWAELREAQLKALALPNTGLAVTIDVGEPRNVHPRDKRPVGQRLARWALGEVYRIEDVYSGPLLESATVEGSRMRLRFKHTGSGLATLDGKPLRGFSIAGSDRKFVWAEAKLDGDSAVVESSTVTAPVALRYGWAGDPDCNLGNREGLPASPFRTDDWPGLTNDAR
jgi:sialate O-acetylesterase